MAFKGFEESFQASGRLSLGCTRAQLESWCSKSKLFSIPLIRGRCSFLTSWKPHTLKHVSSNNKERSPKLSIATSRLPCFTLTYVLFTLKCPPQHTLQYEGTCEV